MAEKKSTKAKPAPKKRAAKKVEEHKPASEVQPAAEQVKAREINWDVIGFSSAAVTLVGAAIFFWIGWIYESTWYGYFGININAIQLSVYEIIAQSIPSVLIIVATISLIYVLAFLIRLLFLMIKSATIYKIFSIKTFFEEVTPYVFLGYIALLSIFLQLYFTKDIDYTFDAFSISVIIYSFSALLGFRGIPDLFRLLPTRLNSMLIVGGIPRKVQLNDAFFRNTLISMVILFSSALISSFISLQDAKSGFKMFGGAGEIQKIYITSYSPISNLKEYSQNLDNDLYMYGPLGYVAENEQYSFFIGWYQTNGKFQKPIHLYLVRHTSSESMGMIPASSFEYDLSPYKYTDSTEP